MYTAKTLSEKDYSLGDIFRHSLQLFKEHFNSILKIVLIVYLPLNIITWFISEALTKNMSDLDALQANIKITQRAEEFIGIFATIAIVYLIHGALNDKQITVKEALKKSLEKWKDIFITSLILGLFLLGLYLLLIIPGIIFNVYWSFSIYVVIVHNLTNKKAMDYSKQLVKGKWWKTFWYVIVLAMVTMLFGLFAIVALSFSTSFIVDPEKSNIIVDTIIGLVGDVIATFFTISFFVLFLNYDARTEKPINLPVAENVSNS